VNPSLLLEELQAGEEALKKADQLGSQGGKYCKVRPRSHLACFRSMFTDSFSQSLHLLDDEAAWKSTASSIKLLSSRLPPSAYPLLALMRSAQTSLISQASNLPIDSTSSKYTPAQLLDEAARLGLMAIAGMQSGGERICIFGPGHPSRALCLATAGKLLLADTEAGNPSSGTLPSLLSNPPTLPPPGPNRLQFGQTLLSQALVELKIGFGHDGGEAGQSVRFAMTELEREREMMMRAAGRR